MSEKKELFHIVTDGSCDLDTELAKEKDLTVVPFYVSFDEEHYKKEIVEVGIRDFYQQMVDNPKVYPKTSMPAVADFIDAYTPYVKAGMPIVCICITTKFSGSYQSATTAKEMVLEDYPDAKIAVIDSTINTVLQGIYVLEAVKLRDRGADFDEATARLEEIKSSGRIFFTVGDMEYLKHGGRIGKVAGIAGSLLGIKPVITLKQGEIFPSGIGRSRKGTLSKCIDLLVKYLKEEATEVCELYSICVGFGYDRNEAVSFRDGILKALEENGFGAIKEIPLFQIGATISVHTGPYPLGIAIVQKA